MVLFMQDEVLWDILVTDKLWEQMIPWALSAQRSPVTNMLLECLQQRVSLGAVFGIHADHLRNVVIPVIFGMRGTGKSRYIVEVDRVLGQALKHSASPELSELWSVAVKSILLSFNCCLP